LRSYRDAGEHYDGQVGSEDSPQQFVDELVGMIDSEWRRVLKPVGSLWLNLGDKYSGSAGGGAAGSSSIISEAKKKAQSDRGSVGPTGIDTARAKSLIGIPWRVALALIDRGWILRAEVIWSKPNGLPESVTDRVRRSHEQWFHFTLEPKYFSAVDEIREEHKTDLAVEPPMGGTRITDETDNRYSGNTPDRNPLGRVPGSVWTIPTEPLLIPDETREALGLVDHFAAFPQEWPRRLIMGWSPSGVCVDCGEGLRPTVEKKATNTRRDDSTSWNVGAAVLRSGEREFDTVRDVGIVSTITGFACACWPTCTNCGWDRSDGTACGCDANEGDRASAPDTRPAVVLDPFGGTGTTAGVAHTLGRHGISVDLSADYCRLAEWRIGQSGHFQKSRQRMWADRQASLL
jgi:DNA modification methylase